LENLIKTYDILKLNDDDTIAIIMEYIDGLTLEQYIKKKEKIKYNEAIFFFSKILNGINGLHSLVDKIIHRDLKSSNILLTKDLTDLKIIDFGAASVKGMLINPKKKIQTNEGHIYATYAYLLPDLLMCDTNGELLIKNDEMKDKLITEQIDFYALGVILYEMLTGKFPFFAKDYNDVSITQLPLKYDVPILSYVDSEILPSVDNIIFKCLACKTEDKIYRYKNICEIIDDVNSLKNKKITNELIKPRHKRVFQPCENLEISKVEKFNIFKERNRELFYEQN
jgi:serine/threonine-protein kinase